MNRNGWCPLLSHQGSEGEHMTKCTERECAWWDSGKSCCVVFSIHEGIQKITYNESYDLDDVIKAIKE